MKRIEFRMIVDQVSRLTLSEPGRLARELAEKFDKKSIFGTPRDGTPRTKRALRLINHLRSIAPPNGLNQKLQPYELDPIWRAVESSFVLSLGEHEVDEAVADVHARAPWFAEASTIVMNAAHGTRNSGVKLPNLLLYGPPGTGKTSWASHVAQSFGVPVVRISATGRGVFALAGVEAGWSSSKSGAVVSTMLKTSCANPIVLIDEIDKAGSGGRSSQGVHVPGITETILEMCERSSSGAFECPHLGLRFDLSRCSWILIANDPERIPEPLIDRFRMIEINQPSREQIIDVAARRATNELGEGAGERVMQLLEHQPRLSLRAVDRALDAAAAVGARAIAN